MKYKIECRRTILGRFCLEPEEEIMTERERVSREIREGSAPLWLCILFAFGVIGCVIALFVRVLGG